MSADIGEVDIVRAEFLKQLFQSRRRGRDLQLAGEKANRFGQRTDGNDLDPFHHGGFRGTGIGDQQPMQTGFFGSGHGDGERSAQRSRAPFQSKFANHGIAVEQLTLDLPTGGQNAQRDGKIKRRGLLGEFGRSEVDHNSGLRTLIAGVDDRAFDTMRALADGRFRQADQHRLGERTGRDVHLDLNR